MDRRPLCHTNERVSCYSRVSKKRATKNLQYSVIKHRTGRFLTDIASIPAITTTILIVHQGSLEFLRTINKVAVNLEGFFFFLFSVPPDYCCLGKVRSRTEMDALQRNYGKTTYYQVRNIRWFLTIFTWLPLYVMTFAIEDS